MAQVVPEQRDPVVGDIVVMEYEKDSTYCPLGEVVGGKCKIKHFAVVEGVVNELILISECNMYHLYPRGCGYRIIPFNYAHTLGYFNSESNL